MSAAAAAAAAANSKAEIADNKVTKDKWEGFWGNGKPGWAHEELRKQHEINWAKVHTAIARWSGKPISAHKLTKVFIPLSGDGPIIHHLLASKEPKHAVTCVELVDLPIQNLLRAYETDRKMTKSVVPAPVGANVWSAADKSFVIHQGDFFTFPIPTGADQFDVVYDRAAFVAISPLRRTEYVNVLASSLRPGGFMFLDTVDRFNAKDPLVEGPPFSASPKQIAGDVLNSGLFDVIDYQHMGPDSNPNSTGQAERCTHQWVLVRTAQPVKK